jgi:Raf kinase inhibitor-like YbhB/YbcL family protein
MGLSYRQRRTLRLITGFNGDNIIVVQYIQQRRGMSIFAMRLLVAMTLAGTILCACSTTPQPAKPASEKTDPISAKSPAPATATSVAMTISSPAFQDGGKIPVKYTCKGQSISPPLQWANAPQDFRSYALILEDTDTSRGTLTHWVVFNISPDFNGLPEGVPIQIGSPTTYSQGNNSFGKTGYDGPCPPAGQSHRYIFSLYALDTVLSQLKAGASKSDVLEAMQGHILSSARLTGIFGQ